MKVVKTLNTMNAYLMVNPAQLAGADHTVFVSGDDAGAKATVTHYERRERKGPKRGRPAAGADLGYGEYWKVRSTFAWLGNFRRLLFVTSATFRSSGLSSWSLSSSYR